MKRVYLFCSAGMSTSMLASKMQKVATSHDLPIEVEAFPDGKIGQIVEMLEQDVEKMHNVNDSIEQVSSVVDNNSATSEETAAVSEAQKRQVEAMVEMMNKFEI